MQQIVIEVDDKLAEQIQNGDLDGVVKVTSVDVILAGILQKRLHKLGLIDKYFLNTFLDSGEVEHILGFSNNELLEAIREL